MIKKRFQKEEDVQTFNNKQEDDKIINNDFEVNPSVKVVDYITRFPIAKEVPDDVGTLKTFNKRYKYSLNNCKTKQEEVLLTLEVLKKEQGIDLYDDTNYGGMWLKTTKNDEQQTKKIFKVLATKEKTKKEDLVDNNTNTEDLITSIFRKNKK
jgi:hypothetical protein